MRTVIDSPILKFGTVVFSGHGTRHGANMHGKGDVDITVSDLLSRNRRHTSSFRSSARYRAGRGNLLEHCNVARDDEGKQFIMLMAKITGHKVVAYDDSYSVTPHGQEWIASPDGSVVPGKLYPPFKGSIPYNLDPSPDSRKKRDEREDRERRAIERIDRELLQEKTFTSAKR